MALVEKLRQSKRWQWGLRVGRLVVQLTSNGSGAPLVDDAWTVVDPKGRGERYRGKELSLVIRRDEHGERPPGPALFVGWRA